MKELQRFILELMELHEVPGMAVGIMKNGSTIFAEGFGRQSVSENKSVDVDTIFPIGSATKSFTSFGIGMLVDKSLVDWDKPVKEYIPEFKLYDSYLTEHVTLSDLASHRTGIPRYKSMVLFNSPTTSQELFKRVSNFKPLKPFRMEHQYNNATYAILGYVIERVSNQKWEEFIKNKIFEPVGMDSSTFGVLEINKSPNCVSSHRKVEGIVQKVDHLDVKAIGPAGSINSNLSDMMKWLELQLNQGNYNNRQLINEGTLNSMQRPHIMINHEKPCKQFYYPSYGLGWNIENYRGFTIVHHPGSTSGCQSIVSFIPEENIGIVVLANKGNSPIEILTCSIYDKLLGLDPIEWNTPEKYKELDMKWDERGVELPEFTQEETPLLHDLEYYVGTYNNPAMGSITLYKLDGETMGAKYGELEMTMTHRHGNVFEAICNIWGMLLPMQVDFDYNEEGQISSLSIPLGWDYLIEDIVFEKINN